MRWQIVSFVGSLTIFSLYNTADLKWWSYPYYWGLIDMRLNYIEPDKKAEFHLIIHETIIAKRWECRNASDLLTIAWNTGESQKAIVDSIEYDFPKNSILPLVANQSFEFAEPEHIIVWQFNRDFYCIADHDEEVSCVGFLFYGSSKAMFVSLNEQNQRKINLLFEVFKDEFEQTDNVQGEMLRMLLVRLIITVTRLGKDQYFHNPIESDDSKFNLFRQFNLLVEFHYKQEHEVQFYAAQLNKSPKTIANVFALYGRKSPSQIIYDRITLEAKRLFLYTDKTAKEVYSDLGFEDPSHFSRFFKKQTDFTPTGFKKLMSQQHREQ